jgi:hypothetical protein
MKDLGLLIDAEAKDPEITSDVGLSPGLGPKRVKWTGSVGAGDKRKRVFILDSGFEEWVAQQYVTIVVTDDQLRPISWRTAGGIEKFRGATLVAGNGGTTQLLITFENALNKPKKVMVADYTIVDGRIVHTDNPDFDPPLVPLAPR